MCQDWGLFTVNLMREVNVTAFHKSGGWKYIDGISFYGRKNEDEKLLPVGCSIEAVVRKEVIVEFPEDMEGDPAVGCKHVVVGFCEHGRVLVQSQVLGQQFVGQLVHFQQSLQLHNPSDVSCLKPGNGQVQRLLQTVVDPLADQSVQIDGSA